MADKEKIKELTEKLQQGVQDTFQSNHFKDYLKFISKFHSYSMRNSMLIFAQCAHATQVAGYEAWKKFGRYVKRGEKGIVIIAPSKVAVKDEEYVRNGDGTVQKDENGEPKKQLVKKTFVRFHPVYVYDVSQTDGDPLPQICNELSGSVKDYEKIFKAVKALSPFPIKFEQIQSSSKGYCDYKNRRIAIKLGMSEAQTIKTLLHEVTHAVLHGKFNKPRDQMEIEAESVAFITANFFGVDTSEYSFDYVTHWSRGKDLAELEQILDNIQCSANKIITDLKNSMLEIEKAQEQTRPTLEKRLQEAAIQSQNKIAEAHDKEVKSLGKLLSE